MKYLKKIWMRPRVAKLKPMDFGPKWLGTRKASFWSRLGRTNESPWGVGKMTPRAVQPESKRAVKENAQDHHG